MGGGDLNMKKSWHPLLMKNQERVWKEERKAVEEHKKTVQLQKELAEERQLQELQRLQAEQGGGKRDERVEWLYATPAVGNGMTSEDQEAYLLGKKTVDKLFKERDEAAAKLQARAATGADANKPGGGFISLQNANTARDTASKIREDPLLAIKQQQQLAYENLKKNPARLMALQSNLGTKEERKKEKKERKREKEEKRQLKREMKDARKRPYDTNDGDYDRSHESQNGTKRAKNEKYRPRESGRSYPSNDDSKPYRRTSPDRRHRQDHRRHQDSTSPRDRHRPLSPQGHSQSHRPMSGRRSHRHNGSVSPDDRRRHSHHGRRSRSPSPSRRNREESPRPHDRDLRSTHHSSRDKHHDRSSRSNHFNDDNSANQHFNSSRSMDASSSRHSVNNGPPHQASQIEKEDTDRSKSSQKLSESKAAKLEEMQAAAKALQQSRADRLKKMEEEDSEKMKIEAAERERNRIKSGGVGDGSKAKFVVEQQKQVFFGKMDLAERVRRSGGMGLVKDSE